MSRSYCKGRKKHSGSRKGARSYTARTIRRLPENEVIPDGMAFSRYGNCCGRSYYDSFRNYLVRHAEHVVHQARRDCSWRELEPDEMAEHLREWEKYSNFFLGKRVRPKDRWGIRKKNNKWKGSVPALDTENLLRGQRGA